MHRTLPKLAVAAFSILAGAVLPHGIRSLEAAAAPPLPILEIDYASAPTTAEFANRGSLRAPLASAHPTTAAALTDEALRVLGRYVTEQSHPDALRYAFGAYYRFKAAHPDKVRKPYLYFVDYGLDSRTARGYVFDMMSMELVDGPFTVAHGRGSARPGSDLPAKFSNIKDSAASSLGLYVAAETYAFRGKSAGQRYASIGLRLDGESGRFNSAARGRGVVVHGAPYVTSAKAGRSEGCPAMEPRRADRLIPKISNGGVVFLFSPRDPAWMREDPWAGGETL